jgi:ribosomal protein S18 acetylase RimI-like enzyme
MAPHPIVVQLPRPYVDNDELQQYVRKIKEVRLKALASDPGSFSSSLAMEIDQPINFWTTRLTHPEVRHFVAYLPETNGSMAEEPFKSQFLATLVLFGPRTIDLNTFMDDMSWKHFGDGSPKPPQQSLEGSHLMYYISAVYVDSDFRRQGIGRSLSIEAIVTIKAEAIKEHAASAVLMIAAEQNNTSAVKLYENLGWKQVTIDRFTAKDGRQIVGVQMRLDLMEFQ